MIEKEENKIILIETASLDSKDLFSKFTNSIVSQKLKDDELILLHYIIETGRFKLMTGWQEQSEIDHIKEWEMINEIDNKLSRNYSSILKRFEIRGFIEASAFTASNNPKEMKVKDEITKNLLDLPNDILNVIMESVKNSHFQYPDNTESEVDKFPW
ncbi:hypothetical protein A1704_23005 [Chryseobacterium cucumeris]|uniref:hypothetical protein n=1 Tax=Chryseobacterium cucumeris TaxID=1813611 RepID=UPI0007893C8D|nr:hypothetical protein [Chryseobacterium cucumeris]KYH06684.1 hypothetical protein A1704_23005 [Chryseobacterium cucumeris]